MTTKPCSPGGKSEIIFIRQESKVQKIDPDDENDPILQKDRDLNSLKNPVRKLRLPNHVSTVDENEEDNEINHTKELKVNGNVVIYMPAKDQPGSDIKYQDQDGLLTPVSFDDVDGPSFPKKKKHAKRSCIVKIFLRKQTYINIVLGIACSFALVFAILTFMKNNVNEDGHLYCYPCESTDNIKEKYRKDGMCCISEPLKNFKQNDNILPRPGGSSTYNGSRILEFQADFQTNWTSNCIRWTPSANINNSFVSYHSKSGQLTLTHTATYVITVSLTTDTYVTNLKENYIRLMVCLIFENSEERKTEECRPITHTKIMNIPFQIVKYLELQNETKLYVSITSQKILPRESMNKLYLVML